VHSLADNAFLSLWTYPNPKRGGSDKELCDVLVVCQPDIVVTSVKEVELKSTGEVDQDRWKRRAVDASVGQIYGAERVLQDLDAVITSGGESGVSLGPKDERRLHRIAVSIGAEGIIPLESRDYGKGFVHVFNAPTIDFLLSELDTITDLVEYLGAREALLGRKTPPSIVGSERDLLAVFLQSDHSFAFFDEHYEAYAIEGAWDEFQASNGYINKKRDDEGSYVWDRLIRQVHDDYARGDIEFGNELHAIDTITRTMAREPRLHRRLLAQQFIAFMEDASLESRILMGAFGTGYVLLKKKHGVSRKDRSEELVLRCIVARDRMEEQGRPGIVIGIATEVREPGSGFSLDLSLLNVTPWTQEYHEKALEISADLGYFRSPRMSKAGVDEFPLT
jgi:hypothetical protein